jgi:predicted Zn-dependent protease
VAPAVAILDVAYSHAEGAGKGALRQSESSSAKESTHEQLLAAFGGEYADDQLRTFIGQTVGRLVASSQRPDFRFRITILNSPTINAFVVASSRLYVTRGTLSLVNDSSELAAVLAHEIAHVIAGDTPVLAAAVSDREMSEPEGDREIDPLAIAASKISLAYFSRNQELEADRAGTQIASRAGYDPYGAVRFLASMGREAELRDIDPWSIDKLFWHPSTFDRVHNAEINARQISGRPIGTPDKAGYLAKIDGMIFGKDPSESRVAGQEFIYPRLGFALTVPAGFEFTTNTGKIALAEDTLTGRALRIEFTRERSGRALTAHLLSKWVGKIDPRSVEGLFINGYPVATAISESNEWAFRIYAIRLAGEICRLIFATRRIEKDTDRLFRVSIGTLRRMNSSEIVAAKPLRVKIAVVQQGDTAEQFATQMPNVDNPLDQFLLLNNLMRGQALMPGDRVKIITKDEVHRAGQS